jgi:membrane protease YdiL (CAAX protease family)
LCDEKTSQADEDPVFIRPSTGTAGGSNPALTNENSNIASATLSSPWLFFVVVLGWSWLFWIPAAVLGISIQTTAGEVLGLLGLLGPMLAGIGFTYLTQGKEGRRDYWSRIIDLKRIRAKWYLVIFLLVPVLMTLTALLDLLSGGSLAAFEEAAAPFISEPWSLIPFVLNTFFIGPFPEELGWRGYVLDRLQTKWNALVSSLILGMVWALWHLPLFFIKDTWQYNHAGWLALFMIGIIPLAVVFTWIFNNTGRSIIAAILFHFMVNFTGQFLNLTIRTDFYSTLLWIIAAIVVTMIFGTRTLVRESRTAVAGSTAQ